MRRITYSVFIFYITFVYTFGSPAFRKKICVLQGDGFSLELMWMGDERLHYLVTSDSVPVVASFGGGYCYAGYDESGNIVSTNVTAHEASQRTEWEKLHAIEIKKSFYARFGKETPAQRYGLGRRDLACVNGVGKQSFPVLLVQFSDVTFASECDEHFFDQHFNGKQLRNNYHKGSVRDYFVSQSDSLFVPQFNIMGKVTLSKPKSHYGRNVNGTDGNISSMIQEAIGQAIEDGMDFSSYATSSNAVPFVAIVFAGEGEQVSQNADDVWAQYFSSLYFRSRNKTTFRAVLVVNEMADYGKGLKPDGIGTFCHEFSHALSLPDMYANGGFGLDMWDIMDYGNFNENGVTPIGYSAYERAYLGWIKPDTLYRTKQRVVLAPLNGSEGHRAFVISNVNDATGNEYYMLENRQASDWFPSKYGSGMLIYHIDYDEQKWESNLVNQTTTRPNISIIPADNKLTSYAQTDNYNTYKGDFFPGYTNNRSLTDFTEPSDVVYNGGKMHVALNEISEDESRNVVFAYMAEGILEKPGDFKVEDKGDGIFALSWNGVVNADAYVLKKMDKEKIVYCDTLGVNVAVLRGLNLSDSRLELYAIAEKYVDSESAVINLKKEPTSARDNIGVWSDEIVKVYTTDGQFIGEDKLKFIYDLLSKGVYVVKCGNSSKIILIQ